MPSIVYVFNNRSYSITNSGFPHSEIFGSKLSYSSPKHIGVSAVLHRLLVPRHPPCALSNLTYKRSNFILAIGIQRLKRLLESYKYDSVDYLITFNVVLSSLQ